MGRKKLTGTEKKRQAIKSEYAGSVPAVDQAFRVLLYLSKNPSSLKVNLTDICKNVGIYKSKGHSILKTLQKYGVVQKDPEGKTYSLGLGLIALSRKVLDNLNYNDLAGSFLTTLTEKTHSTALFGLINGTNTFVVAKQEADQNIGITTRVGHRFSITHGAHGKVMVAFMEAKEREKVLREKELFFHGNPTKLDRKRLDKELELCLRRGFGIDIGELIPGMNIIASPVFDAQIRLIGSIFIMGTFPETIVEEYGFIVAQSARDFSAKLGADLEQAYGKWETAE